MIRKLKKPTSTLLRCYFLGLFAFFARTLLRRSLFLSLFFFGFVFATLLGAWCLGGEKMLESKGIFWVC